MAKKLTLLIDDATYEGMHRVVGSGGIGRFLQVLSRPYVSQRVLAAQYRDAARDVAREAEARAWCGPARSNWS